MSNTASVATFADFGRTRLSNKFSTGVLPLSDIAAFHGLQSIPDNSDLAIPLSGDFVDVCTMVDELGSSFVATILERHSTAKSGENTRETR